MVDFMNIKGYVIFTSSPSDDISTQEAIKFCRDNGLTQEKVKIIKSEKSVMIKVK